VLIVWLLGGNPAQFLNLTDNPEATGTSAELPANDTLSQFVSVVLAETEDVWTKIFETTGMDYRQPKLVLYSDQIQSACGFSSAASGPFYCPGDEKVYLDLSFFREMQTQLGASGDFALAYVVAHEVGHHVQKLTGRLDEVNRLRGKTTEKEFNKIMVRLELQADYYAGIWAHYADKWKHIVETGDLDEAIRAAGAVGDDRLQKQSQGYIVPDSFTHGTSEQRMNWFMKGYQSGNSSVVDPFKENSL